MIPSHARLERVLRAAEHGRILDWILANENRFEPASVIDEQSWESGGVVDPKRRIAFVTRDLEGIEGELRNLFEANRNALASGAGYDGLSSRSLEVEIAAHNDGAHFTAHLDIPVGPGRKPLGEGEDEDRVLSAVYYLHRQPKAFTGGALRLHGFGAVRSHVDIEPADNSLVAFPSWVSHEVRPVACPSRAFADSRFAVNCWFCR